VQRAERRQDREAEPDGFRRRNGPALETCGERLAFEQLHHDERAALVLADLVQRTDVGMADRGGGTRFAQEPIAHLRIGCRLNRLQRHRALKTLVDRLEDDAHAATTNLANDAVGTNVPGHRR
jgi:phage gp46-like protein